MNIENLKVNGISKPLGYSFPYLTFSWSTENSNDDNSNSILLISKDEDFKNIEVKKETKSITNQITIDNSFLEPYTRYYWKIKKSNLESTSYFETAKMNDSWSAKWISYSDESQDSVLFLKEFKVNKPLKSARLYILGYGVYEPYLNDERATDEYLLPGYHSYDLTNSYQTFDITKQLKSNNVLEVLAGNGWYKGRFIFEGGQENIYGDRQKMIAEIHLDYVDGSSEVINTDESWKVETTPILENSIYDGEIIDYTQKLRELIITTDTDTKLLTARHDLPVLKNFYSSPKRVFLDKAGNWVADFGQEISGWVEFDIPNDTSRVKVQYGELLQKGKFYNDNLRTAKQEFLVTNNGLNRHVRPHFTYYGFRYIKVEGLNEEQIKNMKAYILQSKIDEIFDFDSSNKKLNRLVQNAQWSQRDNSLSIPTDCPQRDERMGWTGDITIFCNTAMYNSDMRAFYANYLYNLSLEQKQMNGSIPFFAPYPKVKKREGLNGFLYTNGASTWGDVATVLPMNLWKHYHDKGLLEYSLPIMKGWVDYIHQRDIEHGDNHLWDFDNQLGDWLALDNGKRIRGATDSSLIASVWYYRSTKNLSAALKVLDKSYSQYEKLANQIKQAIIDKYFENNELNIQPMTQTGLAIMLNSRLYPNEETKNHLVSQLRKMLAENDYALNTGFVGTPELMHSLPDFGSSDLAYKLLMREKSPSWLFEVNHGSTTTWERWNSLLEDGSISGTGMNSLNHYAYGSVEDFIIENMLGIKLDNGDGKFTIDPNYTDVIDDISGILDTPNGKLRFKYSYTDKNTWYIELSVPSRSTVQLIKPNGGIQVYESGTYNIKSEN